MSNVHPNQQKKCRRKKPFETSPQAWEWAAFNYIQDLGIRNIYKCACGKYHITHAGSVGDMTHIPAKWHSLFITATPEYEKE